MKEYVRARRLGDEGETYRWWSKLLSEEFPRLESTTRIYGYKTPLSPTEIDDAISEAADRMARLVVWSHKGDTLDSFIAALVQVCKTSCLDVQRKAAKRNEKEGRSLDEVPAEGGELKPWVSAKYEELEEQRLFAEEQLEEQLERRKQLADFLRWALPQLSPQRRKVFECRYAGMTVPEIMKYLDMGRNTVDQNFSRAKKDLNKLKEQYPS